MKPKSKIEQRAAFQAFVDRSILAAVSAGTTSFDALLCSLPSIYPTELLASVNRLSDSGAINPATVVSAHHEASTRRFEPPDGRSLLPLPHPLDFEWRFTPDAARDLLNALSSLTAADDDVLLFGTPGLAAEALSLPTNRRLAFLGEDNVVTRRLIALNDVTDSPMSVAFCSAGVPVNSANAIVLDPPWYIDFIRPMLAAASAACRRDGFVLVSLPPVGTRPSAHTDHETLVRFAARIGLDLVDELPLALVYDTPFFEANALAASGIFAPSRWRRGDLVIFRKSRKLIRPVDLASGRRREWIETSVGRMRLFVKPDFDSTKGMEGLVPIIDGDILPSVSRRDRRRRGAQIWTSGNRIFRTDNASLVIEAAYAHRSKELGTSAQPRLWGTLGEREAVERICNVLGELAAREAAEERGPSSIILERGVSRKSTSMNSYSSLAATAFG